MARTLTEKQQKFLDVLFDEARGDILEAKKLAGYSPSNSTNDIINSLREEEKVMDRVGIIKSEKVQVEAIGGVMILPPKRVEDDD